MADQKHGETPVWSIVLAGGEGERVKPLVQRWLGRHRPKQYCAFVGTRSMFQHTVDRAAQVSTLRRTVVVAARHHEAELRDQLVGRPVEHLLLQPANSDTAAGVFLPLTYVRARDPKATVVLLPSDHFVYPEARFLRLVRQAIQVAERGADRLVLLGVRPDRLELEYGWIEPEPEQAGENSGEPVRRVRRFLEKPEPARADEAMRNGALWNTLVLATKAEVLWELGWQCFPEILVRFQRLGDAIGGPREAAVLEQTYEGMPLAGSTSSRPFRRIVWNVRLRRIRCRSRRRSVGLCNGRCERNEDENRDESKKTNRIVESGQRSVPRTCDRRRRRAGADRRESV